MGRVALGVEYDGSQFVGWQTQKDGRNIQDTVEQALSSVADHKVSVVCAGRTDAGVHAWGQVIHFDTHAQRESRAWTLGTNTQLPPDVSMNWAQSVDDSFHARFSARSRSYRYLILERPTRSALERDRACWTHKNLDVRSMSEAGKCLVGEHDFSAFRAAACQAKSARRHITELTVAKVSHGVIIEVTANAFLQHMVRNIAGMLMVVGCGDRRPEWAQTVLESKDRRTGAVTASAGGLYLMDVCYPSEFEIPRTRPVCLSVS